MKQKLSTLFNTEAIKTGAFLGAAVAAIAASGGVLPIAAYFGVIAAGSVVGAAVGEVLGKRHDKKPSI